MNLATKYQEKSVELDAIREFNLSSSIKPFVVAGVGYYNGSLDYNAYTVKLQPPYKTKIR